MAQRIIDRRLAWFAFGLFVGLAGLIAILVVVNQFSDSESGGEAAGTFVKTRGEPPAEVASVDLEMGNLGCRGYGCYWRDQLPVMAIPYGRRSLVSLSNAVHTGDVVLLWHNPVSVARSPRRLHTRLLQNCGLGDADFGIGIRSLL